MVYIMIISFFEEFPEEITPDKLRLVAWPSKLYLASRSLEEFNSIKLRIDKNFTEIVYWPILEKSEGYWISPLSDRNALIRITNELDDNTPILFDIEMPRNHRDTFSFARLQNFHANRRMIEEFLLKRNNIYTAEYYPGGMTADYFRSLLGLHFNPCIFNNRMIKMIYSSMHDFDKSIVRKDLEGYKRKFGDRFIVGYGTIAKGVSGNEPLLSLEGLVEDIEIAKAISVGEIVIFRLGGLNKEYATLLKKYC